MTFMVISAVTCRNFVSARIDSKKKENLVKMSQAFEIQCKGPIDSIVKMIRWFLSSSESFSIVRLENKQR